MLLHHQNAESLWHRENAVGRVVLCRAAKRSPKRRFASLINAFIGQTYSKPFKTPSCKTGGSMELLSIPSSRHLYPPWWRRSYQRTEGKSLPIELASVGYNTRKKPVQSPTKEVFPRTCCLMASLFLAMAASFSVKGVFRLASFLKSVVQRLHRHLDRSMRSSFYHVIWTPSELFSQSHLLSNDSRR